METFRHNRLTVELHNDEVDTMREVLRLAHERLRNAALIQMSGSPLERQAGIVGTELFHVKTMIEKLAKALGPINKRLFESADAAEWRQIAIGADMSILAIQGEGEKARPYALLSESEKWRADAMIAEAVSHLSGVRLLVLDRFDCLDLQGREDALYWLDELAAADQIDSALIFGTLKALPAQLPDTCEGFWIENGAVAQLKAAA